MKNWEVCCFINCINWNLADTQMKWLIGWVRLANSRLRIRSQRKRKVKFVWAERERERGGQGRVEFTWREGVREMSERESVQGKTSLNSCGPTCQAWGHVLCGPNYPLPSTHTVVRVTLSLHTPTTHSLTIIWNSPPPHLPFLTRSVFPPAFHLPLTHHPQHHAPWFRLGILPWEPLILSLYVSQLAYLCLQVFMQLGPYPAVQYYSRWYTRNYTNALWFVMKLLKSPYIWANH